MAKLLWGKVYYGDVFAGLLNEEPGGSTVFTYDVSYLEAAHPSIAHTLPPREQPYRCLSGLHPFFDNLVAEGWLERAQTRLLGQRAVSRFELLLAFGQDCAGAVSILDPEPSALVQNILDLEDAKQAAILTQRASLSGVQPKLALVQKNNKLYTAKAQELSTHIAKFASPGHPDIITNEFLTTQAYKILVGDDEVVNLTIGEIQGFNEPALIIPRFDRTAGGRIHFEEFNALLGKFSPDKYKGAYKDMADFIHNTSSCLPAENYKLFLRVLTGILLGNTDMHLKNFAMFHTPAGLRLTPSYDQVTATLYDYKTLALAIGGAENLPIGSLKPGNMIKLNEEFALPSSAFQLAINQLDKNREAAKQAMIDATWGTATLKNNLIKLMEKRWNGTFALIGKTLSKKR